MEEVTKIAGDRIKSIDIELNLMKDKLKKVKRRKYAEDEAKTLELEIQVKEDLRLRYEKLIKNG